LKNIDNIKVGNEILTGMGITK